MASESAAPTANRSVKNFSAWLNAHGVLASLLVLVCSLAPRLLLTTMADVGDLLKPDSYTYLVPAVNLAENHGFVSSGNRPEISRTPGYPALIAGIMTLVGQDIQNVLIVQSCLFATMPVILYWSGRVMLMPLPALAGAMLAALSPWNIVLSGLLLSEGLFLLLLALVFLLLSRVHSARSISRAAWVGASIGVVTGAAVLVRPIWLMVVFVAAGVLYHYGPKRKGALLVVTAMVICASLPLIVWQARNVHETGFTGISDTPGKTVWWYLASRVKAKATGEDRFTVKNNAMKEEDLKMLSPEEADRERWRRAQAVFREYPGLTLSSVLLSASEHVVHPSPDDVLPPTLRFQGDYWALSLLWGGMIVLAFVGWLSRSDVYVRGGSARSWLAVALTVCVVLTLSSGASFGSGSRMRAPLELIVPLLAAVGLVHITRSVRFMGKPAVTTAVAVEGRP